MKLKENGKKLLEAMNYLEDALIENEAVTATLSKQQISPFTRAALKWGAVAAAALLFLGGGVAYAAKYGIFRTEPGWESGYHVDIVSRRVTEEEFSEEVLAVKQELSEDIAVDEENRTYFGWIQDFNSLDESVEFIGHTGMKAPEFPGTLEQTSVVVVGNDRADILKVEAYARYSLEETKMMITASARVYTSTFSEITGAGWKENGLTYSDETYITANGKEAVIVIPTKYRGNSGIEGFLVDDSVIYELTILCYEEDHDRAMQLMKDWLDQF